MADSKTCKKVDFHVWYFANNMHLYLIKTKIMTFLFIIHNYTRPYGSKFCNVIFLAHKLDYLVRVNIIFENKLKYVPVNFANEC